MLSHTAPKRLDLSNINTLQVPSGPPSPTLSTTSFMSSVSWMAEKTSHELIPMLKNAYSALKDKEKGEFNKTKKKKKRILLLFACVNNNDIHVKINTELNNL